MTRVLIIDDSRVMRAIEGRILRELGCETFEAGNGREALEFLKNQGKTDLAIVDWNMPEMDGLEFVRAVRAEHVYDDMQIMMVTTENGLDHVTDALKAGANEYVMKPFAKDVIRKKLQILGVT
ncbi:MAG TPA: response regulator [Terriglobia bacterium]|jgi:two-component system chemotaxis response regulator CheY|nr:response regulator [Terriglobia bacterium]